MYTLMSAEYQIEGGIGVDDEAVIKLFCRDRNGRRVILEKRGFKPYFYAPLGEVPGPMRKGVGKALVREVSLRGNSSSDEFSRLAFRNDFPVARVEVNLPKDVVTDSVRYSRVFEDKILFPIRFLIDRGICEGVAVESDGIIPCELDYSLQMKKMYLDIEVVVGPDGEFPDPVKAPNPILCCTISVGETSWQYDLRMGEAQMLRAIVDRVMVEDPDVIVGWGVFFDIATIVNRAKRLGVDYGRMSPMGWVTIRADGFEKSAKVGGRNVFDLLPAFKRFYQGRGFDSYKLDDIAALPEFLGIRETFTEYKTKMNVQFIEEVLEYNARDVEKVKGLDGLLGLTNMFDEVRRLAGCSLEQALNVSQYADVMALREFHGKYVLGTKKDNEVLEYEGAIVIDPITGVHSNIVMLDFAGMYPSILLSNNMSPETLSNTPEGCYEVDGIYFRKDVDGIIPNVIRKLTAYRGKIKKLIKEAGDPFGVLEHKQYAVKQMVAAVYGYFAFVYSRMYYPEISKSITFVGRRLISKTKEIAEGMGFVVAYGDTDSIFIITPEEGLASRSVLKDHGTRLEVEINKMFEDEAKAMQLKSTPYLEFETAYYRILLSGVKKRYAGWCCIFKGKDVDQIIIKGMEARRSDSALISRHLQKTLIPMLLKDNDEEAVRKFINNVRGEMLTGNIPWDDAGIPKRLKKSPDQYTDTIGNMIPILYANHYMGHKYGSGDRPLVFYVKHPPDGMAQTMRLKVKRTSHVGLAKTKKAKWKEVTYVINRVALDEEEFERWHNLVDWEVQTEKVIEAKVSKILNAWGISFSEVISGQKQLAIEDFFGGDDNAEEEAVSEIW